MDGDDDEDEEDDGGKSNSGKADKPKPGGHAIGGKTDKPDHDDIGESETDDADDEPKPDSGALTSNGKADKPKPGGQAIGGKTDKPDHDDIGESASSNNGVLTSTMDEPKPMSGGGSHGKGAPYDDKATLLFALGHLGIDPEHFPNMSDEEREEVLMMLDGELNFDIGGGGGGGGELTLVDGGGGDGLTLMNGELNVVGSSDTVSTADGWNFSGSCEDDDTVQLESFEDGDSVIPPMHGVPAMTWMTLSVDPWSQSTTRAHDGRWSTRSGITPRARRGGGGGRRRRPYIRT